jgi:tetratricopeptide (TPR) repeat protein
MEKETYSDAAVVAWSNRNLLNVELWLDKDGERCEKLGVESIPVTFLFAPDGSRVGEWAGYVGPKDYVPNLEKALVAHGKLAAAESKLAAAPEDVALLKEAAGLNAALGRHRPAADRYRKAAAKAGKEKGRLLVKALESLQHLEGEALPAEMLGVVAELEAVDAEGKLGLRDDALYFRARAALARNDADGAVKAFEAVVDQHPDGDRTPLSLLWLADLYHHGKKDHARAQNALKTILEKYPKSDVAGDAKEMLEHVKEHSK